MGFGVTVIAFYVLKQVPQLFRILLTFHRHAGEERETEFSFLGELHL